MQIILISVLISLFWSISEIKTQMKISSGTVLQSSELKLNFLKY